MTLEQAIKWCEGQDCVVRFHSGSVSVKVGHSRAKGKKAKTFIGAVMMANLADLTRVDAVLTNITLSYFHAEERAMPYHNAFPRIQAGSKKA